MNLFENADEYGAFIESLKNGTNDATMNAVNEAYDVCMEGALGSIIGALIKGGAAGSKGLIGAVKGLGKGVAKGSTKAASAMKSLSKKIPPESIEAFKGKLKEFAKDQLSDEDNKRMINEMGEILRTKAQGAVQTKIDGMKSNKSEPQPTI